MIPAFERTLESLNENLAFDESMLLCAEDGVAGESLRFWESTQYCVVLGAGGSIAVDVNEPVCESDGVTIHRRASGGGTVLLGPGCLVFSLVLSYDRAPELAQVSSSYRWILDRVAQGLHSNPRCEAAGISDLVCDGRKISGNSQQRKSRFLLHHGTILYDFDLSMFPRYLKPPERSPEYRQGRDHSDFVANLKPSIFRSGSRQTSDAGPAEREDRKSGDFRYENLARPSLMNAIRSIFCGNEADVPQVVLDRVPTLVDERYCRPEWVRRR